MPDLETVETDVVVIGAGFSGLAAARVLGEAGANFLVLEARDRVGGRVKGDERDGAILDLGGTWVGPTQGRALELAAAVGAETFPQYAEGANQIDIDGEVRRYSGTVPRLGPLALAGLGRLQHAVNRHAKRVGSDAPWDHRHATRLDAVSFAEWMRSRRFGRSAEKVIGIAGKTTWGAEPDELSALYVFSYVAGAGGTDPLFDTEGGAQESRFVFGAEDFARRLAGPLGDRVSLGSAVESVEWGASGAVVTAGSLRVTAGRVIITAAPPLCERIAFEPQLPARRDEIQRRMRMGALTKAIAIYDEPFWRADGLSGESLSDASLASITFDLSPPDGSRGVLVGFVGGDDARAFAAMGEPERRANVLAGFERLYGPKAASPQAWVEQQWAATQWSGGGPVAIAPPGALTAGGDALRKPCGPIHWAGTESSPAWGGFIDGAIRAGERAAAEALAAG